jgi:hypothetical protein
VGQQQLLLIILGVIIVGFAIALGIALFGGQSVTSNRDAMFNDLNNLGAQAHQYRVRISSMGGGQGSYVAFSIPPNMRTNENATYSLSNVQASSIEFLAVSASDASNTIKVTVDSDGKLNDWAYGGDFQ